MIGEECVKQAFDVEYVKLRAIIVASLPMDRLEQERPSLFWVVSPICRVTHTLNREEFCREYCRMCSNRLDRDRRARKLV